MSLTVADILHLDGLANFRLEAGIKGLDREVKVVGMLDYESGEEILKNFANGEFVVTTLVAIKDDLSQLDSMVDYLIEANSAGLAIKTIYLDRLPESVAKKANAAKYPIFLFEETFFETIITDVRDAILLKEEDSHLEWQIDQMLSEKLSPYQIRRVALEVNRGFEPVVAAAVIRPGGIEKRQRLKLPMNAALIAGTTHKLIVYRDSYLIIATAPKGTDPENLDLQVDQLIDRLNLRRGSYTEGLGQVYPSLEALNEAVSEAILAEQYARAEGVVSMRFANMGLGRLFMSIKDYPQTKRYYDHAIQILKQYDEKHGTELLDTVVAFVAHQGDVKATAEELYQHANTIRYRMDRVKNLMGHISDAELAILVTLHKIYR